jgi:hypothetical protein
MMPPLNCLVVSVVLMCGWIAQMSVWFTCEVTSTTILEHIPAWCPNAAGQAGESVGRAKAYVVVFVAIAFSVTMSLSAADVESLRKMKKGRKGFGLLREK